MCLLVLANNVHENYKLILAANRDEFYKRPALPAQFWGDNNNILAGKDLQAGGTWLGITKQGRISAITNYRDLRSIKQNAPSRGSLTYDFLNNSISPEDYYSKIKGDASTYNGFNLTFGILNNLWYFSNVSNELIKLDKDIYGISNHLLDTPWHKVEKAKAGLAELIFGDDITPGSLFNLLTDTVQGEVNSLPDTGVGLELEKILSPVFIKTVGYGTRSSTVILIDRQNKVSFTEKTYIPESNSFTQVNFNFEII